MVLRYLVAKVKGEKWHRDAEGELIGDPLSNTTNEEVVPHRQEGNRAQGLQPTCRGGLYNPGGQG
jgi:hypothetical protein